MNHLWNLIRKELKELLTPASVIPIIAIAIVFAGMGTMIGSEVDRASEAPTIGILSGDSGIYYDDAVGYIDDFYINALGVSDPSENVVILDPALYSVITSGDANAVRDMMNEAGVSILLVFDSEYSNNIANIAGGAAPWKQGTIYVYWNDVEMGLFGSVSTAVVTQLVAYVNTMTAKVIIEGLGGAADPVYIQFPVSAPANRTVFNGEIFDDITPADIASALQSQSMLMPIL
ncbi:MAG: hypothetical protein FWF40_03595, partial [Methanomassiliicoccaceae archaeon]|nr:hypothetical protein [Methanomassiliicoccaceae archaeon]